jgi:large subunit ribosomal protein L18
VIDDVTGKTLCSVSSAEKGLRGQVGYGGNCDAAAKLGKILAERASAMGIKTVAFDRGAYKYHGRVAAFADAAREAGLDF